MRRVGLVAGGPRQLQDEEGKEDASKRRVRKSGQKGRRDQMMVDDDDAWTRKRQAGQAHDMKPTWTNSTSHRPTHHQPLPSRCPAAHQQLTSSSPATHVAQAATWHQSTTAQRPRPGLHKHRGSGSCASGLLLQPISALSAR